MFRTFLAIFAIIATFATFPAHASEIRPFDFVATFSDTSVQVTIEPKVPSAKDFRLTFTNASGKILQSAVYGAMSRRGFLLPVSCQFVTVELLDGRGTVVSAMRVSKPDNVDSGYDLVRKPWLPESYVPMLKSPKFLSCVASADRFVASAIRIRPSRDTATVRTLRNDFVRLLEAYFISKSPKRKAELAPLVRAKAAALKTELAR